MARHNRQFEGVDQCGHRYRISYRPDWLQWIKITRCLASGRQSTKTLFRNPADGPAEEPDGLIRTRIESPEQGLSLEFSVRSGERGLRSVRLDWTGPRSADPRMDRISFTITPFRSR